MNYAIVLVAKSKPVILGLRYSVSFRRQRMIVQENHALAPKAYCKSAEMVEVITEPP
jgi:hypothetical protein